MPRDAALFNLLEVDGTSLTHCPLDACRLPARNKAAPHAQSLLEACWDSACPRPLANANARPRTRAQSAAATHFASAASAASLSEGHLKRQLSLSCFIHIAVAICWRQTYCASCSSQAHAVGDKAGFAVEKEEAEALQPRAVVTQDQGVELLRCTEAAGGREMSRRVDFWTSNRCKYNAEHRVSRGCQQAHARTHTITAHTGPCLKKRSAGSSAAEKKKRASQQGFGNTV